MSDGGPAPAAASAMSSQATAGRPQAEAGTGFRFPTLSELYFNGVTPRGDTLGNPRLEPETNRALQLSVAWEQAGWSRGCARG